MNKSKLWVFSERDESNYFVTNIPFELFAALGLGDLRVKKRYMTRCS